VTTSVPAPAPFTPSLVLRRDLPILAQGDQGELEVRPFREHAVLAGAIPSGAMAWIAARPNQEIRPRSHTAPALLIVLRGDGELVGLTRRSVKQGDVITLPANQHYGFTRVGPNGLQALHVLFAEPSADRAKQAHTLELLLSRNEQRAQASLQGPFFELLRTDVLSDERKRDALKAGLRVFSDAFQTMILTRQVTCRDDKYFETFHRHLLDELLHNRLLNVSGDTPASSDPVLHATSSWFCHQMLVLDNVGKAVLHLVLETAGYHFHNLARPVFEADRSSEYFLKHAEDDAAHKDACREVLSGQHPQRYRKLLQLLDRSWDMFEAMGGRIAELVAGSSRS
jgi:quercetin dioxygenase-like cupin family protein